MSKLKCDIIHRIYNENCICKEGHSVKWTGSKLLNSNSTNCTKCGSENNNKNPLRWECSKCNENYCSKCFDLIIDKVCPLNHKLKFYKLATVEFFSLFTCDKCFQQFQTKEGVFFDKECNLTICPNCYYDSCDIPDIIED